MSTSLIRNGIWVLIGFSIFSCLSRNDYNLIAGFLLLIIFNNYSSDLKFTSKITIHILSVLTVFDLVWLIAMSFVWDHKNNYAQDYWSSLSWMHTMIFWFGFIEMVYKIALVVYMIINFKKEYSMNDLLNLNYKDDHQRQESAKSNI